MRGFVLEPLELSRIWDSNSALTVFVQALVDTHRFSKYLASQSSMFYEGGRGLKTMNWRGWLTHYIYKLLCNYYYFTVYILLLNIVVYILLLNYLLLCIVCCTGMKKGKYYYCYIFLCQNQEAGYKSGRLRQPGFSKIVNPSRHQHPQIISV